MVPKIVSFCTLMDCFVHATLETTDLDIIKNYCCTSISMFHHNKTSILTISPTRH